MGDGLVIIPCLCIELLVQPSNDPYLQPIKFVSNLLLAKYSLCESYYSFQGIKDIPQKQLMTGMKPRKCFQIVYLRIQIGPSLFDNQFYEMLSVCYLRDPGTHLGLRTRSARTECLENGTRITHKRQRTASSRDRMTAGFTTGCEISTYHR